MDELSSYVTSHVQPKLSTFVKMKLVAGILVCRNGVETHTRASTKTAVPQPDTMPAAGIPEHIKHSYNAKGPAIE